MTCSGTFSLRLNPSWRIATDKREISVCRQARKISPIPTVGTSFIRKMKQTESSLFKIVLKIKKELERQKETIREFPKEDCGKKTMAIYVDIYGNEFREVFKVK